MQLDASYSRMDSGGGPMLSHNIGAITNSGSGNLTVYNYPQTKETKRTPVPRCPLASSNFVGRAIELDDITHFFFGEAVPNDQQLILAVIGIAGCGKTQLVRKFMECVYRKFKDKLWLVFYVDASTTTTLANSLAAIAKANGYDNSSDAALAWMANLDEPFFIYFDNADDHAMNLRNYFPKSLHARIVITTRLQGAKQKYTTRRDSAIILEALSEVEAKDLLIRTTGLHSTPKEDVAELIQELHCHALAVVQAGAAIANVQWTIRDYLERFKTLRTSFMDGKRDRVDAALLDDYPSHVYTTWKLSYNQLSSSTTRLLGLCAHFHHAGITEEIFHRAYKGSTNSDWNLRTPRIPFTSEEPDAQNFIDSFVIDGAWSGDDFRQCIQEACSYSLLSYDLATRMYSVHPLIHDCLRSVAPHPSQTGFLLVATMVPIWQDEVLLPALVPHVQRLLKVWPNWWNSEPPLHPMLANHLGRLMHNAGRWTDAEPLTRAAVVGYQEGIAAAYQENIRSGNTSLGTTEGDDGGVPTVMDFLEALQVLANRAETLSRLGDNGEVEKICTAILQQRLHLLGRDHPDTIMALSNCALTFHQLGRYKDAETLHKEVLDRRQRVLGMDHPDTITAMGNLATTYHQLGRYTEQEKLQKEVLQWRQRVFGTDHPETVSALDQHASALHQSDRYEEAEKQFTQVLEWRQRELGLDHPDTILVMEHLAATFHQLGRRGDSEKMKREVLEWRQRVLGEDHPDTLWAMGSLAQALGSDSGRLDDAEKIGRDVLERQQRVLGADHPDTIRTLSNLGRTLHQLGRHAEAEPFQCRAVEMRTRILGANHPDTLDLRLGLAYIQSRLPKPTNTNSAVDVDDDSSTAPGEDNTSVSPSALEISPSIIPLSGDDTTLERVPSAPPANSTLTSTPPSTTPRPASNIAQDIAVNDPTSEVRASSPILSDQPEKGKRRKAIISSFLSPFRRNKAAK